MSAAPSERLLALVKRHEGLKLDAYRCPAGVWTIGYGSTRGVRQGQRITEAQAEALLRTDLDEALAAVDRLVTVRLAWNEREALASFVFNLGAAALRRSNLLRLLNARDRRAAAEQFDRWVWSRSGAKRVVLPGLVKRRAEERALFEGKVP
jgi:GH24 family phage-related lysozyme (muramidase)